MSSQSLISALQSVVSLSEKAVAASEEAMAAARLASIQANSALAAGRLALQLESSRRSSTESLATRPKLQDEAVVENELNVTSRSEESSSVPATSSSCVNCQKEGCLKGKYLINFQKSFIGRKVRLVGSNWSEEMKSRIGMVEGFEDGFLRLQWFGKGKVKKIWPVVERNQVGEFQFQFCCDEDPSFRTISPEPSSTPTATPPPSSARVGRYLGQFVTHYEDSYIGLTVRYCGVSGVGKNWTEERKNRVGVIEGFESGYLQLKWTGEEKIKKFLLTNSTDSGLEYQFRFCERETQTVEQQRAGDTACQYCRNSPCYHGKRIYPRRFKESQVGRSVKYCGTEWSQANRNRVGVVVAMFEDKIMIKWGEEEKAKLYPMIVKNESQFQFHCRDPPPTEVASRGVRTDYERFQAGDVGLRVEYVGPDKSITGWVGTVQSAQGADLTVRWVRNNKESSYRFTDSRGNCVFKIVRNEGKIKDEENVKEEFGEDEEIEEPLVLLSDPHAEILDVDLDTEDCPHCKLNISKCLDGKLMLYYHEQNRGKRIKYCGNYDGNLKGRTGVVSGFVDGCIALVWSGETEQDLYPLLIPSLDGRVSYQDQEVEYQFQFCCTPSSHQLSAEAKTQSEARWFVLKLQMYQVLALPHYTSPTDGADCDNCRASHSRCLHGQFLLSSSDARLGLGLQYVGQNEKYFGQLGTVSELKKGHFKVRWDSEDCNSNRNFFVTAADKNGTHHLQFKYHCHGSHCSTGTSSEENSPELVVVKRLPVLHQSIIVQHKVTKDKHKIIFSVSEKIHLHGVGLDLCSSPNKVTVTVCRKSEDGPSVWSETMAGEVFSDLQPGHRQMMFKKPIELSEIETYLLAVSFLGGSSYLSSGGLEFVEADMRRGRSILFKFESEDNDQQVTDVEKGVIPSIYFSPV